MSYTGGHQITYSEHSCLIFFLQSTSQEIGFGNGDDNYKVFMCCLCEPGLVTQCLTASVSHNKGGNNHRVSVRTKWGNGIAIEN